MTNVSSPRAKHEKGNKDGVQAFPHQWAILTGTQSSSANLELLKAIGCKRCYVFVIIPQVESQDHVERTRKEPVGPFETASGKGSDSEIVFPNRIALWKSIERCLARLYAHESFPDFCITGLIQGLSSSMEDIVTAESKLHPGSSGCVIGDGKSQCHLPNVDLGLYSMYGTSSETDLAPSPLGPVSRTHLSCKDTHVEVRQRPNLQFFDYVAMGGTFDHLHVGHKLLLSVASWLSSTALLVGLTTDALLETKKFKDYLESESVRSAHLLRFLELFNPTIDHSIMPIQDRMGPLSKPTRAQALVVSTETLPGAQAINEYRESQGLPKLDVFAVSLLPESPSDPSFAAKISSTNIRKTLSRTKETSAHR